MTYRWLIIRLQRSDLYVSSKSYTWCWRCFLNNWWFVLPPVLPGENQVQRGANSHLVPKVCQLANNYLHTKTFPLQKNCLFIYLVSQVLCHSRAASIVPRVTSKTSYWQLLWKCTKSVKLRDALISNMDEFLKKSPNLLWRPPSPVSNFWVIMR